MAIKFSELRGLLKDTNIQTVKMSDPAYNGMLERIHGNYYILEQNHPFSFYNLNEWKNKNQLYKIKQYYPLHFYFYLRIDSYHPFKNVSMILRKQSIINSINKTYNQLNNLSPNFNIIDCYKQNKSNVIIINPFLYKIKISNYQFQFPLLAYRNGGWKVQQYKWSERDEDNILYYYDNIIIDYDENIPSSVPFYTNPITYNNWLNLEFYYGYKPNDKVNKRWKIAYLRHNEYGNLNPRFTNTRIDLDAQDVFYEKYENPDISVR